MYNRSIVVTALYNLFDFISYSMQVRIMDKCVSHWEGDYEGRTRCISLIPTIKTEISSCHLRGTYL